MTVQTNTSVADFAGNGVTTAFPIGYKFNSDSDLVVLLIDDDTGTSTTLTLNSDYTVDGAGDDSGGTVTITGAAPAEGQTLRVSREVDALQLTDLRNQGKFYAEVHEEAFDKLTMLAQQNASGINSAIRVAASDPVPERLPSAIQRANKLMAFDEEGNPIAIIPSTQTVTGVYFDLATNDSADKGAGLIGYRGRNLYDRLSETLSVSDFGAHTGADMTPAERRAAMQAAIDAAAGVAKLHFPAGEWVIDSGLKFRSDGVYTFEGVDRTIFKLSDDADDNANVWEPYTRDGTTDGVAFRGGFTIDGNYSRPTVSGVGGINRPGASGFITAGARNVDIDLIKVKDCALHGLDITCGGWEDETGRWYYVNPDDEAQDHWPDNESRHIRIGTVIAENCGDDGVTGHYSRDVHIDQVISTDVGSRHSVPYSSNAFEIDDGCRNWHVGRVYAKNANRGVAIKSHAGTPGPQNVSIDSIVAERCAESVYIYSPSGQQPRTRSVTIGTILALNPATPQSEDPLPLRALHVNEATDVSVGVLVARAEGDETDAWGPALLIASAATRITIGNLIVTNWARNNDSDTAIPGGLRLTSTASVVNIGQATIAYPGILGIMDTGSSNVHIGRLRLVGDSISGSTGVSSSAHPSASGLALGSVTVTGFTTSTQFGGTSSARGLAYVPSDFGLGGRLFAGVDGGVAYHYIRAADRSSAGDEVLRLSGASLIATFHDRGAGSGGANAANTCVSVATMETTGRSINAGGTINASGADYAEYMTKRADCGVIEKGAVCGVDEDGLLTDQFDLAHSFVIKSTDPSYVGGDTWARHLGERPEQGPEESDADFAVRLAAFEADLEAERQKVDRIAFAGQVPCSVSGSFSVGDYIIPSRTDDGGIEAVAVSSPDTAQYLSALGRVWAVKDDKAWVVVKVV